MKKIEDMKNIKDMKNIENMKNIEEINDPNYYLHPIYDYWILTSHNTYLPYDQYMSDSNMCYYNLILNIFMGGSIEIDLYGIYKNKKSEYDIKIRHSSTKQKFLKLSKVLQKIVTIMKEKYNLKKKYPKIKYPIGPLIISFDNKNLFNKKNSDINHPLHPQNIFWKILQDNLLKYDDKLCNNNEQNIKINCPWIQIISENTLDYKNIILSDLDMKILLRGKENLNLKRDLKENLKGGSIEKLFIPPPNNDRFKGYKNIFNHSTRWFHISNTKLNSLEKKNTTDINMSESIASYGKKILGGNESENIKKIENEHSIFPYVIENTKSNLIRIFPDGGKILSQNYDNLGYLMNGCQLVALNLQTFDKSWCQNMAIFNPDFFLYEHEHFDKNLNKDEKAIDVSKHTSNTKSYVLKPKWLRDNNIKYPENHNISLQIQIHKNIESKDKIKLNIEIGKEKIKYEELNTDTNINIGNVKFNNINVTLPILYIKLKINKNRYIGAYLLEWDSDNLKSNNIEFYLHNLNSKKSIGSKVQKQNIYYNNIKNIKNDDEYNICDNAFFHSLDSIKCNITDIIWTQITYQRKIEKKKRRKN
jgi:hypothetical protein